VQYEYEASDPGDYKLCIELTEMAFQGNKRKVKTSVTFNSEFHRNRRKRVEREAGIFDQGEKSLVGGQTESGNMHTRAH
jgi:hypothetical protein